MVDLHFTTELAKGYHSGSQISRVLTEDWVERIPQDNFCLDDVYAFVDELQLNHPDNNHVHDKIRQQLQFLRDKGFIHFFGGGRYRKIN